MSVQSGEEQSAERAEQRASTMTTTTTTDGMMAAVPNETVERMYIKREKKTVPGALAQRAQRWQGAHVYLAMEG